MGGAGVVEFGEIVVGISVEVEKVVDVVSFEAVVESCSVVDSVVSSVVEENNSVVGVVRGVFAVDVTFSIVAAFIVEFESFVTFAENKIILLNLWLKVENIQK